MPTTLRNTDILFNDATTQSTANNLPATTTNVLNATAGASFNAVGSYALASNFVVLTLTLNSGDTTAGSNFAGSFQTSNSNNSGGTALVGTWRCMGYFVASGQSNRMTLFLRIA